uniref:F-BAR domain-containing protein n=1 Tax=Romanomermis culicivorax TaxID=13658 RepID=A0A915LEA3_ROMCU
MFPPTTYGYLENFSAGEYMTWELTQCEKSATCDLTSDDVSTSFQLSTMPLTASSATSACAAPISGLPNLMEYGSSDEVEKILLNMENGVELALDYAKGWSRYCKEILYFVQQRINLELEHAKKIQKLTESTKSNLQGMPFLPLKNIYDACFLAENEMLSNCTNVLDKLHEYKFVKPLEARKLDHDQKRKELLNIWEKQIRQLNDIKVELRKAKQNRCQKQLNYRKARESSSRLESLLTAGSTLTTSSATPAGAVAPKSPTFKKTSTAATTSLMFLAAETLQQPTLTVSTTNSNTNCNGSPQISEIISSADKSKIDKKRRAEEDAMIKSKNAQEECSNLEIIFADKCKEVEFTKLHELIYQCDQTTKACTSSYFQALSSLWDTWPGKYLLFSEKTRDYIPGYEYLNFARSLIHKNSCRDQQQHQQLRLLTTNNAKTKLRDPHPLPIYFERAVATTTTNIYLNKQILRSSVADCEVTSLMDMIFEP